jgi:LPS sulfotransferase NodH
MATKADFRDTLRLVSFEERIKRITTCLRQAVAAHLAARVAAVAPAPDEETLDAVFRDSAEAREACRQSLRESLVFVVYAREMAHYTTVEELTTYLAAEVDWPPMPSECVQNLDGGRAWPWGLPEEKPAEKNPAAAFVLSPPRSGSTLLRKMLANHPALFVPPEPNLLMFERMGRRRALTEQLESGWIRSGPQAIWQQLDQTPAQSVDELENEDARTQAVYRMIQTHCGGRMLVDQSPLNAAHVAWLGRAESIFESPKYIHLVRHPRACNDSFVRVRIHRLAHDFLGLYDENPWCLAEKIWVRFHQNILAQYERLQQINASELRYLRVRYEDLIADPVQELTRICTFLDLPFEPIMLDPFSGKAAELTGPGDPNWNLRSKVDRSRIEAWQQQAPTYALGDDASQLAQQFGYDL